VQQSCSNFWFNSFAACDKRTSRRMVRQALLIMSNLLTKGREDVGWGYTHQWVKGLRECGWELTALTLEDGGRAEPG